MKWGVRKAKKESSSRISGISTAGKIIGGVAATAGVAALAVLSINNPALAPSIAEGKRIIEHIKSDPQAQLAVMAIASKIGLVITAAKMGHDYGKKLAG